MGAKDVYFLKLCLFEPTWQDVSLLLQCPSQNSQRGDERKQKLMVSCVLLSITYPECYREWDKSAGIQKMRAVVS